MEEKRLTVHQVAAQLQVHPKTVLAWIAAGRLPAIRLGKGYRIIPADLRAFETAAKEWRQDEEPERHG